MAQSTTSRREFLRNVSLGVAGTSLGWGLAGCGKPKQKPNIIFILADDLGYGELGCYGQQIIRTPNIDRLAAEGLRFTDHYAGSPVCAPSRCVLMTGKHTGHATIRDNKRNTNLPHDPKEGIFSGQWPIPDEEVTVAEWLKQAGYVTGAIGKWGLGMFGTTGDPLKQGFDFFYGYNCQWHAHTHYPAYLWRNRQKEWLKGNDGKNSGQEYSQDLFIREAKRFIRENKDRPFFLYLPFIIPHLSIQVPEESLNLYKGKIPEEPYVHRDGYKKHPYPRAAYAAMITHMDKGIGEIMSLLQELGLDENTVVFFTSDNGPTYNRLGGSDSEFFRSAGPFRGLKGSTYEGGIRVPMIVRWPGHIQPGSVTAHISAFYDVFPTLCDLAGLESPPGLDGISFAPTLFGQKQPQHQFLYWEFPSYGGQQAVRMGQWKAVRMGLKQKDADPTIQLYNLKEDPGEQHNVAAEHPDLVRRFAEIMKREHQESTLFPFPEILKRPMTKAD